MFMCGTEKLAALARFVANASGISPVRGPAASEIVAARSRGAQLDKPGGLLFYQVSAAGLSGCAAALYPSGKRVDLSKHANIIFIDGSTAKTGSEKEIHGIS